VPCHHAGRRAGGRVDARQGRIPRPPQPRLRLCHTAGSAPRPAMNMCPEMPDGGSRSRRCSGDVHASTKPVGEPEIRGVFLRSALRGVPRAELASRQASDGLRPALRAPGPALALGLLLGTYRAHCSRGLSARPSIRASTVGPREVCGQEDAGRAEVRRAAGGSSEPATVIGEPPSPVPPSGVRSRPVYPAHLSAIGIYRSDRPAVPTGCVAGRIAVRSSSPIWTPLAYQTSVSERRSSAPR